MFCACPSIAQTVAPFMGIGNVQFEDNNGQPLANGVLYAYTAGTTTFAPTYTDSTGTVQNPNPIPFDSGGRAAIWLLIGNTYKFVLCSQNDGAACASGDTLFTVDQVPGGSSGGGGGSSPFTGIFISSSANPATSGILRLASNDSTCWRNTANSANLCWQLDSNNVLNWLGGALRLPQVVAPTADCVAGFGVIWSDATSGQWNICNGTGAPVQIVQSGVDINTANQVVQLHFGGGTGIPLSSTPPTTGQPLVYNGVNIGGGTVYPAVVYNTASASVKASISLTTMVTPTATATYRFSFYIDQTASGVGCVSPTATTVAVSVTYQDPNAASTTSYSAGPAGLDNTPYNGVPGPVANWGFPAYNIPTTGQSIVFRALTGVPISYSTTYALGSGCTTGQSYQVFPILEQLTSN